ncbi:MFS transporter [Paenibacillus sp. HWE-109]|nr:MFS transporter [Paenibacillus sp. HWE-109]UKS29398.1 MFS transporter [Paenibacillus sp. HWE-109]
MALSTQLATSWPYLRLYALAFLFFSANAILNVIVPIRSESMGASNTMIGIIMGTYMLTCMLFRPWAGHIVHKYGAAKVLRVLLIINGGALILYTVTGLHGFIVARLLQGASTAFFSMALQIAIIESLSDEQRSQGVSLYSLFTYMPTIVGPLIALGIWGWGGMQAFTVTMIAIAVITGLFGYRTRIDHVSSGREEEKTGQGVLKAVSKLVRQPDLLICSVLMFAASVVFGSVAFFIPLYVNQVEYGNAGIYFMLQAGVIVLSRFMFRKRVPSDGKWHPRFVSGIMLLAAVAAMLLSISATAGPLFLYLAAILMGIAQAMLYPTLTTYLTFVLPTSSRNIMLGIFIASADLGVSLGGVAMGPIADLMSFSVVYMLCSCIVIITAGLAVLYNKRLNRYV